MNEFSGSRDPPRDSEARFRAIFEQAAVGISQVDLDGRWIEVNQRLCDMVGYTQAELLQRRFQDITHPDDLDDNLRDVAALLAGQAAGYHMEKRYVARGGAIVWVEISVSLVRDAHGTPHSLIGVIQDITERKRAEQALRESEARLRAAIVVAPFPVMLHAEDGEILELSRKWSELTGYPREAMPTIFAWHRLAYPDIRADFERLMAERFATEGETANGEWPVRTRDGATRIWDFHSVALGRLSDGRRLQASAAMDVTDRKAAEAALREANERLEARVAERTADLLQAEEALRQSQKMEAVGQLTGGLAHDFNNLLAALTGNLELAERKLAQGRTGEVPRHLTASLNAAARAASLTQRLLAFSRQQALAPQSTDINRLVAGMEDLIRRTVGHAISVTVAPAADLWSTLIDANQLETALLNLCINARDAMPDGGSLTIATGKCSFGAAAARARDISPGDYVMLSVHDTGTGMPPDVRSHAFDPFFTTKPIGSGSGLGLSMVYGFVRQSGGQVRIASEVGEGTTVVLYLPREDGPPDDAAGTTAPGALPARDGETVLVVDDDASVRLVISETLRELGYAVREASDGPEGLHTLRTAARIDLLLTDVGLPGGLNGRQLAEAGRAVRPGLRVLFITGHADAAVAGQVMFDAGMQVMTKPFTIGTLGRRVRQMLATPPGRF